MTVTYPTRTVLEQVTLGLQRGDRIGVVGVNGSGKSTLTQVLSGMLEPDSGSVVARRNLTVGHLSQRDELVGRHVLEAVVGDTPEHVWAGDPHVRDIFSGLLDGLPLDAEVGTLSGGQTRRVALAQLLAGDWDVLILDEPTNHLDIEGISWLAQHLSTRWRPDEGALVVVTHDRWFLDAVTNRTWEVEGGHINAFEGGYAAYTLGRVERDRIAAVTESKRKNLLRKELAWLRRGAPARTAKPKFRLEAASELIEGIPPPRDQVLLEQLATARLGKRVIDVEHVRFGYEGAAPLFEDVTWRVAPGERAAVLGPNGSGKTTLLNLMTGNLSPTGGRVKQGKTVKIGFLDQQFAALEKIGELRVREVLAKIKTPLTVQGKEVTASHLLEQIGFTRAHLSSPVQDLSGGQKRRLQLLLALVEEPNVLILDEPTNDVDTDFLTAMEDLLDSWPGTLIVVSHDRYLLERVTDEQYGILHGELRHLPGGVEQYLAQVKTTRPPTPQMVSGSPRSNGHRSNEPKSSGPSSSESDPRGGLTLTGAQRHGLQKQLASIERRLAKKTDEVQRLQEEIAAWDQSDFVGLTSLAAELKSQEEELETMEETWLDLADRLDSGG